MISNSWLTREKRSGSASGMFSVTMTLRPGAQRAARSSSRWFTSAFWPWLTTETVVRWPLIVGSVCAARDDGFYRKRRAPKGAARDGHRRQLQRRRLRAARTSRAREADVPRLQGGRGGQREHRRLRRQHREAVSRREAGARAEEPWLRRRQQP